MISEPSKAKSFPKSEKLKLKKQIDALFHNGKAFQFEYLRFIWMLTDISETCPSSVKFGVSVPKKKIPKAHQRNTIKRRIREAWRLQQHALKACIPAGKTLCIFVIYQQKDVEAYAPIAALTLKAQEKLISMLARTS